ncbi:MAG: alcohol dehydrogenase catalytic domain-containing protein [Desulfomonilia bacterium]|nr:alcohol dehydrogenase catalytic domain-containing protein [Desulfomonilia bacterium]
MKAVVYDRHERLKTLDIPDPVLEPDQVLIKVSNTGFCGSDHSLIESGALPDGYIVGHEVSGTVAEVGSHVSTEVPLGTRVMIRPTYCGACRDCLMGKPYLCRNNRRTIGIGDLPGGVAEYVKVYPGMLIAVPDAVDSVNAALAEMFAASLHAISVSGIEGGPVLVIGCGPIGLGLVRLLKILGFGPIAVSEPVEIKRNIAQRLGADTTIDPFTENVFMHAREDTGGYGYETVFECSGAAQSVSDAMNFCANGGTVCIVSVIMKNIEITPMILNFKEILLTGSYSNTHEENRQCLQWMAQGLLDGRPLISDTSTLDELPALYRDRIDTGNTIKVMLSIGEEF